MLGNKRNTVGNELLENRKARITILNPTHMRQLKKTCITCGKGVMAKKKELWPENTCQYCGEKEYARRIKQWAVDYLGGKCVDCGYSKCIAALQFDHRDPSRKLFRIGGSHQRTLKSIQAELDKCDLRCGNCHTEKHYLNGYK